MVDRFCETQFKYLSLQSPFQEIFDFESKYVIQLHAGFVEDTNSDETTDQGVSFEKTTRVSFCRAKLTSGIKKGDDAPSRVRSSRAARRILERVSWTRLALVVSGRMTIMALERGLYQISRLLRRPYSPASFNSASKRAASKGLDTFTISNHALRRAISIGEGGTLPSRDCISFSRHLRGLLLKSVLLVELIS